MIYDHPDLQLAWSTRTLLFSTSLIYDHLWSSISLIYDHPPSFRLAFSLMVGRSIPLSELGRHFFQPYSNRGWVWFEHRLKHDLKVLTMPCIQYKIWKVARMIKRGRLPVRMIESKKGTKWWHSLSLSGSVKAQSHLFMFIKTVARIRGCARMNICEESLITVTSTKITKTNSV